MTCALSLALLALAGCSYYPECGAYDHDSVTEDGPMCESRLVRTLTVSSAFTPEQQAAIVGAGEDWREATGGRVALSWRIVDDPADVALDTQLEGAGLQWSSSGRIALNPGRAWDLQAVAAHELGHSFGLGHTPDGENMAVVPVVRVTPDDVAHFDALWSER